MTLLTLSLCSLVAADLPAETAYEPLEMPHFPSRLHAFVWRNYPLVPTERMAEVLGCTKAEVEGLARSMGLPPQPAIGADQWRRSYITILRRNWEILPFEQMTALLGWTEEELAFTLREDDFLWIKMGSRKPEVPALAYHEPTQAEARRADEIAQVVGRHFPGGVGLAESDLFGFVDELSAPAPAAAPTESEFHPRYCYSYFATYGDPLMEPDLDPYPDGYLARLAASGVDGVWLQAVLYKLTPFPWDPALSEGWEQRLAGLRQLSERAREHGVDVYLYLNEPRAMPLSFFEEHPELRGVTEGDHATLCTSLPEVREYLREAVRAVAEAAPELGGFFTITASENLTNCWSHYAGAQCERCAPRGAAETIAELNAVMAEGAWAARPDCRFICWDWGWDDEWAADLIGQLPRSVWLQSVSEWSLPIERGGVESVVGEYSISSVGPGPRATRHWELARERGLATIAKIQAGNTWELSAVPYIPAVGLVAQHAANLRAAEVDGLMLGWTLGGYPSPNLEVVAEIGAMDTPDPQHAMHAVAGRRYGPGHADAVVEAWQRFSQAFAEFPFHIGTVYAGPMQRGPANPLFLGPTGRGATMVGFPYDDLTSWRQVYPPDVWASQMEKVAEGFEEGCALLHEELDRTTGHYRGALEAELSVAEAAALHLASCARQARFVMARDDAGLPADTRAERLRELALAELEAAKALHRIQVTDPRIGFEASNQYYYIPIDLVEKVVKCEWIAGVVAPS
ncbi:MAG: hypothetical protein GF320_02165 [Armatimonadia bacterium]|nr:hypothetical protein [Armatimonadia bacterium]